MKRLLAIMLLFLLPLSLPAKGDGVLGRDNDANVIALAKGDGVSGEAQGGGISELIFGHVGDSYEWHITTIGSTNVVVYLPVIVRTSDGTWHIFSSKRLYHASHAPAAPASPTAAHASLSVASAGLHIAPEGEPHEGKIVDASGARPLDLSITKNVLALMFSSLLLVVLVLLTARWYKRHNYLKIPPKGLAALMEPLITMVHDMARTNIGEKDFRRYSPFLLTAFMFILLNNILGIIPFFPAGANLTGNIAITLVLALFTFFTVNLTATKHYYKEIVNPDVPLPLKPVMAVIELFSAFVKPLSLTIRLFANMLAGHIQLLCMVSIVFIMAKYGGALFAGMSVISVLFGVFLDCLEILISFIQAYIFTMLSSIYIGLARTKNT